MEPLVGTASHWVHETVLSPDPTSAWRARDFVALQLVEHGLLHLVDDLRLAVSELATNAMRHARTPFTVTLQGGDASVLLTVKDGSTEAPALADAHVLDLGGRGLSIVACLSREWGVIPSSDGTKSVWASFDQHAPRSDGTSLEPVP